MIYWVIPGIPWSLTSITRMSLTSIKFIVVGCTTLFVEIFTHFRAIPGFARMCANISTEYLNLEGRCAKINPREIFVGLYSHKGFLHVFILHARNQVCAKIFLFQDFYQAGWWSVKSISMKISSKVNADMEFLVLKKS